MNYPHTDVIETVPSATAPWWLRLGTEAPRPVHGCAAPDCGIDLIAATDVYCRTHETFLAWGPRKPRAWHYLAIGAMRIGIAAGFFFTALLDSMLPVWGVAVVCGLAIAVLPLRLYDLNARFAVLYWLVAAAFGFELWLGHFTDRDALLMWCGYIGLAAWWGFMALVANSGGGGRAGEAGADRGGQLVAVTMTVALPALAASAIRPEWRELCLILALGGVSGALLVAAIIGVLRGGRHLDPTDPPQLSYLHRPGSLRWHLRFGRPEPGRASGPIDRLARGVLNFLQAVLAVAVTAAGRVATIGRFLGFAVVFAATVVVNWVVWISVEASRRILGSIVAAALVCWVGARIWWVALWRSVRVMVLPLAFVAGAAVTITWWSEAVRQYLADGSLDTLAWIGAGVLAAAVALTLMWTALSGQPLTVSLRSAMHSANIAATKGLLVLAFFAGALGAPGTLFDVGPIRWGPLTAGVFILLGVATAIHFAARAKQRTPDNTEESGPSARDRADRAKEHNTASESAEGANA
ncbi:hypothetical protein [Glycomyces salinus]|uniref:hypothetical protein n=1 Tax=Glycomyces salinus TaxID=980294 RepID=UPI0018ECCDD1|nr:hypothetical protein [Glycomyces salinus]